jgi:photosystem II stability/assembly factor-like uncharacterized protein
VRFIRGRTPWLSGVAILTLFGTSLVAASPMTPPANGATAPKLVNPVMLVRAGESDVDYVIWSATCATSKCYRMERLSDGGQSDVFVTAPPIRSSKSSNNLSTLVFANPQDGYAVESAKLGSDLFATFNGGASWQKDQIRPHQVIIWMTATSTNFYAVTSECAIAGKACGNFQLNRSVLASKVWSDMPLPIDADHNTQPPDVAAYGPNVWLTGQQQAKPYKSLLASSRHYGQDFGIASVPTLQSVNGCEIEAVSTKDLWAQCDEGMMAGTVPYSDDGGVHWTVNQSGHLGQFHFGVFDPVSSALAFFVDPLNKGVMYRVTNGAADFQAVGRSPDPPTPGLLTLAFTNAKQGLALSYPSGDTFKQFLYRTENSGRDWVRVLG